MKFAKDTSGIERYIAIDIHKEYALVGGQNTRQGWVMQPRRIGIERFSKWAEANLRIGDAVVLETCTSSAIFGHKGLILYGDFCLADRIIHPRFVGAVGDVKS